MVGFEPTSNFSFELVKSVKICPTSTNSKMFATEEKKKHFLETNLETNLLP